MRINIIGLLVAFYIMGYGLYKAYQVWRHKIQIGNSKGWPTTYGTVTDSTVKYRRGGRGGKQYYAEIAYTYMVMGGIHNGVIILNDIFGAQGAAESDIELHPEASSFGVRYDPNKPELHVVDFDTVRSSEIFIAALSTIIGLIWLVVAVFGKTGK